jgi:hypothetical protein
MQDSTAQSRVEHLRTVLRGVQDALAFVRRSAQAGAPGDTIVIEAPHTLTEEVLARLRVQVEQQWPGVRAVILDQGLRLHAVRQVEGKEDLI